MDTWGKIPSGLLHGNIQSPGHFTECVQIRYNDIQGQHCMTTVTASLNGSDNRLDWDNVGSLIRDHNLTPTFGVCLPASCSPVKVVSYSNKFLIEDDLEAVGTVCRTNDTIPFSSIDHFALTVFGLLLIALLASTIYEVVSLNADKEPNRLLTAFSVYTNGAKLFEMKEIKSPNVINCLNGIRTLSIFWIMFGHRFDDRDYVPVFNDSSLFYKNYVYLLFTNYDKPVDTFFLIGGLLVTMSLLNSLEKKKVNILRMYLHRYLRYTPSLAVIILFYVSFTKFLGAGPFFDTYTGNCEKYWWSALLHLTVYTNPLYPCYDVSWYLAVDFQLFVISPLLIYPIWKWGRKAFWTLPAIVVLVQGCIFTTTYTKNISVYFFQMTTIEGIYAWLEKFYFPTHLRLGAWVIGIMLGYVLHHTREKKVKVHRLVDAALWILSISVLLTILLCHYPFIQLDHNRSKLANAVYNSCFRIGWSYSVAWIIFACQNGSGGIVKWFLSWKEWQPFGKLGLSIYLVHRLYQIVTVINQKQPIVWDFFTQSQKFFGDVLISTFLGTILYLSVENPVLLIESYLHEKVTFALSDGIESGKLIVSFLTAEISTVGLSGVHQAAYKNKRYELSSLGRLFVIDEEFEHLPIIRQIFAIVTASIGVLALTRFLLVLTSKTDSSLRLANLCRTIGGRAVLAYIFSHLIHSIHYVDNIRRPVAYFEPKWLYQKYVISEMEITFFANVPITLFGLYFMEQLVGAINGDLYSDTADACKKMIWYIIGSLLTLGHYRTEPPWKYEAFVNFTIAGEGVATILLALLLYQLRSESLRKMNMTLDLDTEQSAGLLDDDKEQKEYAMKMTGVRSRTPVKH